MQPTKFNSSSTSRFVSLRGSILEIVQRVGRNNAEFLFGEAGDGAAGQLTAQRPPGRFPRRVYGALPGLDARAVLKGTFRHFQGTLECLDNVQHSNLVRRPRQQEPTSTARLCGHQVGPSKCIQDVPQRPDWNIRRIGDICRCYPRLRVREAHHGTQCIIELSCASRFHRMQTNLIFENPSTVRQESLGRIVGALDVMER